MTMLRNCVTGAVKSRKVVADCNYFTRFHCTRDAVSQLVIWQCAIADTDWAASCTLSGPPEGLFFGREMKRQNINNPLPATRLQA